jgi:hypothetical protein
VAAAAAAGGGGGNSQELLAAAEVVSSRVVVSRGLYAPLTLSGSIIINNVAASVHRYAIASVFCLSFDGRVWSCISL